MERERLVGWLCTGCSRVYGPRVLWCGCMTKKPDEFGFEHERVAPKPQHLAPVTPLVRPDPVPPMDTPPCG